MTIFTADFADKEKNPCSPAAKVFAPWLCRPRSVAALQSIRQPFILHKLGKQSIFRPRGLA
jgi:hypothetical protein